MRTIRQFVIVHKMKNRSNLMLAQREGEYSFGTQYINEALIFYSRDAAQMVINRETKNNVFMGLFVEVSELTFD